MIILMNNCKRAIIDECNYELVSQWNWFEHKKKNSNISYAIRNRQLNDLLPRLLHRFIWFKNGIENTNIEIDHKDGDGLNNLESNLRIASRSQNGINRGPNVRNMSGYKGVTWNKCHQKWQAQIGFNSEIIKIGMFLTKEEAARAYNRYAYRYFKDFAWLNPIDPLF